MANVALISRAAGAIRARDLRAHNFSACGYANTRLCTCYKLLLYLFFAVAYAKNYPLFM